MTDTTKERAPMTNKDLIAEIARELYDRFVMGGWEPQDAYVQIGEWLRRAEQSTETPPMQTPISDIVQRNICNCLLADPDCDSQPIHISKLVAELAEAPRPVGTPEYCPSCGNGKYARGCVATRKGHALTHIPNTCDCVPCTDPWHDGPVGTPERGKKP